jgi:acetyl esterase/lipase
VRVAGASLAGLRGAAAALLVAAALLLAGCEAALFDVANGADVVNGGYARETDLAYGAHPRQRLDVYRPEAAANPGAPATLVVFLHGGRWSSGSKDLYRFVGAGLAERGIPVVVPNYRLYPEVRMPEAMADVAAAVAWAQANAARYGSTADRVVVMGHSAGAHLAALLATDGRWLVRAGGAPVRALVGLAGPYDFLPIVDADLVDYFGPPVRFADSQPVNFVSTDSAPAFLAHGRDDSRVRLRNTESFAARLRNAGVPVELHLPAEDGHVAILARFVRMNRWNDPLYEAILRFLREPPTRAAPRPTSTATDPAAG